MHGVGRDNATFNIQRFQQNGEEGYLVGFVLNDGLGNHRALFMKEGGLGGIDAPVLSFLRHRNHFSIEGEAFLAHSAIAAKVCALQIRAHIVMAMMEIL